MPDILLRPEALLFGLPASWLQFGGAVAEPRADLSARIAAAIPDDGRGQMTASGLRGVLNAPNGAIARSNNLGDLSGVAVVPNASAATWTLAHQADDRAPVADPPFTGLATVPVLKSTAIPSITQFFSGQNVQLSLVFDATAQSARLAEQTGAFRMTSNVGGGASVSAYKMALGAESICGPKSSDCWGQTVVLTTQPGYPASKHQIAFEVDQNNDSATHCPDADLGVNGTVGCGTLLVTGGGKNQVNFGIAVSGYSKVRNGLLFPSGGPVAASIRDYSSFISVLSDSGTHSNGIALSGAYSAHAYSSPGFTVSGGGAVTAANFTTAGQVSTLYGRLQPVTYATIQGQRPCNPGNQGIFGFVTDSKTATFNAAVTGGGTNAIGVICNGTAYVAH